MTSLSKDDKKRAERRALRQSRHHDPQEHQEKDSVRARGKASEDTKEVYRNTVKLFIEYMKEEKNLPEDFAVGQGYSAPSLKELKAFIRFYINSSNGIIDEKPTMKSTLLFAQRFVPGFYCVTGNEIPSNDSRDLYSWIQRELVEEGTIRDVAKEKYNFMVADFKHTMVAFWVRDDPFFMTGRYRVQFPFLTHEYLCTGARIGAYTPAAKDKFTKGLRYKYIQIILFRATNAPWRIGWRVDQTWVKNNRNAEYRLFGIPIWDQDTPIFAGALPLLALALTDNALYGYKSADEVWQQRIPPGEKELALKWNEEAENRCIVRGITATKVSEASMTKAKFHDDFRRVMNNADYFKTATIHALRRALGAVVDEKYTRAQVAQVLTHKSQEIYGQDYVAHITRVDTVNSLLGKEPDTTLADYFQGFS
ncbi:hypothetical protein BJX66DRAFT_199881 [Aspergillus keveii]|uniref:Tyr recombinase domain-containing protein n=1 Tax=Aspergillus keveii TaxID=714993 RepID=A0ABR4FGN2_9EURO